MPKRIEHWSPRYVRDRFALIVYERRNPDAPWLTSRMIEILDQLLKPSDVGLEWGSGRSTIWLGKRVGALTTIEDNTKWSARVEGMIEQNRLGKKVRLIEAPLSDADIANPGASLYLEAGRSLPSSSLNFALVDGALRDHCAAVGIEKLKHGGFLVIDNVERHIPREVKSRSPNARSMADGFETAVWADVFKTLKDWRCIWTSNGVFDTALWLKP